MTVYFIYCVPSQTIYVHVLSMSLRLKNWNYMETRKKTQKTLNRHIFCIVSTDSVEEDFVSDTDDEDELSVVAVNEDQNVCSTFSSEAI